MKLKFFAPMLAILVAVTARGDIIGPQPQEIATSPDCSKVARVFGSPWDKNAKGNRIVICSYNKDTDSYLRSSGFVFGEFGAPHHLFVTNDGKRLVGVDISLNAGRLRIYDSAGKLLKIWKADELLSPEELAAVAQTGARLLWYESGWIENGRFILRGPSHFSREGALGYHYRIEVDLGSLALEKRKS